jgi:SsrA-binding protein
MKKESGKPKKSPEERVVCRNRRALHEYFVHETLEAGLALTGTEVKSLRCGHASIEDSYARLEDGELWLLKADIPEYAMGNIMNHQPKRKRKLLLHRRELRRFAQKATEKGFTIVPLKLYFRGGWAKVELAVVQGKKLHDKRETLKEKTARREIERATGARRPKR